VGEKENAIENYKKFHDKGSVFDERFHDAREIVQFRGTYFENNYDISNIRLFFSLVRSNIVCGKQ
jgi:hypothetical protein